MLLQGCHDRKQAQQDSANLITALQAKPQQAKDNLGETATMIPVVQTTPKIYLQATEAAKDPEVIRLRHELDALKGAAKTATVAVANSTERVDAKLVNGAAGDEWYSAQVIGDSLHYRSRHEFTATILRQNDGVAEFIFKDRNPHDSTTAVRAYAPLPERSGGIKWWHVALGALAGYAAGR
jgi:hypothetical protein